MAGSSRRTRPGPEAPHASMLDVMGALANPHRLRIIAALHAGGETHVSQLARDVGLSRPLLYLHLRRLEDAGLIRGKLALSDDGKALKQYVVGDWAFRINPEAVADEAESLGPPGRPPGRADGG